MGANVNKTVDTGRTALLIAALEGKSDVVDVLLQAEADINIKFLNPFCSLSLFVHSLSFAFLISLCLRSRSYPLSIYL
jgi:ankyrin repeat protein